MLAKFGLNIKPAPDGALRRLGDTSFNHSPRVNPGSRPAANTPMLALPPQEHSVKDRADRQVRRVNSLADIGKWRAAVPELVLAVDEGKCVVLDREFSTVLILATAEFYSSGSHAALLGKIRKKHLSIEAEVLTSPEIIAAVQKEHSQRGNSDQVIQDDQRNLALYEDLVRGAFALRASDLHIEIDNGATASRSKVKLRRYGRMRHWKEFDTKVLLDAVAAGYNSKTKAGTASGASWSQTRSLNTITEHTFGHINVNGRFSTYPVISGLDVVVRLLENDPNGTIKSLRELGYEESQINGPLYYALQRNSGLIALVGGTGSGKSTTLQTMMDQLPNKDELKRYSVEDPVEYRMPGVRQISIQRGADDDEDEVKRKFLSALRMLVRLDPDVAMIGEIRDAQSGTLACEMVQTGHRVLTTFHGDGVVDALSRMTGRVVNISQELLATRKFISAIIYQKLLPVLCENCRRPAQEVLAPQTLHALQHRFHLDTSKMFCSSGCGCEQCTVDGIASGGTVGVTAAAEIFVPEERDLVRLRVKDWGGIEAAWRGTRRSNFDDADMTGKTAFEHALYKASQGVVDPQDIEREFESFLSYRIVERSSK